MPLSPRFEELMNGLELKDALWHLQRANSWVNQASEEELIEWYSRILQLIQNTAECVTTILEETSQEREKMESIEKMLEKRDTFIRQGWINQDDNVIREPYQEVIWEIAEYVRLSKLLKQAQMLQDKKWIQIWDIVMSVELLPDNITRWEKTISFNKARILAILPHEAAAA